MNPGMEYYRAFGTQAQGSIKFLHVPTVGDTVTVGSTTYTFGTDFVGRIRDEVARSLVSVINADRSALDLNPLAQVGTTTHLNPVRNVFAVYYGNIVIIVASAPGTAGNSIALASSAASRIAVSGANLTGGVNGTLTVTSAAATAAAFSVIIQTIADPAVPEQLSGIAIPFQRAIIRAYKAARVKNTGAVWVQFSAVDASSGVDLEPGETYELIAPEGKYLTTDTIYIDAVNAGDGVVAILIY